MQQLNSYRFYELGARLHSLFESNAQGRVTDMFAPLTEAQALLDGFIKGETFVLDTSKADATRLLNRIGAVFNRYFIDPTTRQLKGSPGEDRIDPQEISIINSLIEKFEHALAAELNHAPTYVASKRGIYSTYDLAQNAEAIFTDNLRQVIPSASQHEFNTAGRALVFGLGTAAAIHMLRAIEISLKFYYESFTGTAPVKGERNYALYLKKLAALSEEEDRESRPDKRIIQMLAQIKDHYRNPLLTPEYGVSLEEALQLFGMASALISLMAEQIASRQKVEAKTGSKTSPPSVSTLTTEEDDMYDFRMSQAG